MLYGIRGWIIICTTWYPLMDCYMYYEGGLLSTIWDPLMDYYSEYVDKPYTAYVDGVL